MRWESKACFHMAIIAKKGRKMDRSFFGHGTERKSPVGKNWVRTGTAHAQRTSDTCPAASRRPSSNDGRISRRTDKLVRQGRKRQRDTGKGEVSENEREGTSFMKRDSTVSRFPPKERKSTLISTHSLVKVYLTIWTSGMFFDLHSIHFNWPRASTT